MQLILSAGQTVVLEVPEQVTDVFLRITEAAKLNGKIIASKLGCEITLVNKNGFIVGPDVAFEKFSGIRLAAIDKLFFKNGSVFSSTGLTDEQLGNGQANYDVTSEQLTGYIKEVDGERIKGFREEVVILLAGSLTIGCKN